MFLSFIQLFLETFKFVCFKIDKAVNIKLFRYPIADNIKLFSERFFVEIEKLTDNSRPFIFDDGNNIFNELNREKT